MSNPAFKFDHVHIISRDPEASANWYVEMFGATITANTMARGAPQIFVDLGGMTILYEANDRGRTQLLPGRSADLLTFPATMHEGSTILDSCTKVISPPSATNCGQRASPSRLN